MRGLIKRWGANYARHQVMSFGTSRGRKMLPWMPEERKGSLESRKKRKQKKKKKVLARAEMSSRLRVISICTYIDVV